VASRLSQIAPIKRFFRAEPKKGSDEHNNTKQHYKENNLLHSGAKRAVVCGEDQNQTCP
jgi:hypothetical protein